MYYESREKNGVKLNLDLISIFIPNLIAKLEWKNYFSGKDQETIFISR